MKNNRTHRQLNGFTLIELLVTICVFAILLGYAVPSFFNFISTRQLQLASETLYNDILLARSEALKTNTSVYVSFKTGTNWCYGLNNNATCDCQTANNCVFNGTTKIINSTAFSNVSLASSNFATANNTSFDPLRGADINPGTLSLSRDGKVVNIIIDSIGYVRICSNDLPRYKSC